MRKDELIKYICLIHTRRLPWFLTQKNLPAMQEIQVRSLGCEDPLEKGMATHSSILAWRIPWTEELQSMGSQKVRYDLMTEKQQQHL